MWKQNLAVGLLLAGVSTLGLTACFEPDNPTIGKWESADALKACGGYAVIDVSDKTITVGEDGGKILRVTHEQDKGHYLATVQGGAAPNGSLTPSGTLTFSSRSRRTASR